MGTRPTVLYACMRNSGRSVAAQVLTRHHGGDRVEVRSAGSQPGSGVNPVVAQVLAEGGLPVTDHTATKLDSELVQAADVVITMSCGETCPLFPGKRYEDWTVDDPAGQDLESPARGSRHPRGSATCCRTATRRARARRLVGRVRLQSGRPLEPGPAAEVGDLHWVLHHGVDQSGWGRAVHRA